MKKSKFLSLLSAFLALLMVFTSVDLSPLTVYAEDVDVKIQNMVYVDVLLSRGKTRANTVNFENDVTTALQNLGVDTTYVNFIKNDSVTMVGQAGFNQYTWTFNSTKGNSGNRSVGHGDNPGPKCKSTSWKSPMGQFGFVGSDLELVGNDRYAGNMILRSSMPSNAFKYTMDFDYDSNFGDNFNGAGVFLNAKVGEANQAILVYIAKSSTPKATGIYQGTINADGTFTLGTKVGSIAAAGHLSISVVNGEVTINGTAIPGYYEGTEWGFYTSQYSHGCQYTGRFNFKNLVVEIETSKEFKTVLTEEQDSWTPGYEHVLVDVVDEDTETAFQPTDPSHNEVLNLMDISKIHFIGWGTTANQTTLSNYVKLLSTGGIFCDMGSYDATAKQMTNYQAAVNATAQYIANLIKQRMTDNYVIITDPQKITVDPAVAANQAQWSFKHDITKLTNEIALDNDLGYSDWEGASNIAFPSNFIFDKPGMYSIWYNNKLVKQVAAHRKPSAVIAYVSRSAVSGSTYNYVWRSDSFDSDSNADAYGVGKGIKSLVWEYRVDGGSWISAGNGITATIPVDVTKNTNIRLTATDFLGAQSVDVRTINSSAKPVAYFTLGTNPVSFYENISIIDGSYDPLGRTITSKQWVIKNSADAVIYNSSTTPNFTPISASMGEGTYTVSLTVTNDAGVSSYTYSSTLTVKRVIANALYQYNWGDASHGNYANSVQVEYLNKYPSLVSPQKYYRYTFDKNTGTQVDSAYLDAYASFNGWFLDETLTNQITPGSTQVMETGNHYIYAKWTDDGDITFPSAKKIYTVNFNANDTELDRATLSSASLTETWTFNGWFEEAAATTHIGNAGYVANDVKAHKTVYAGWTDVPVTLPEATRTYTVTYDSNGGTNLQKDTQPVVFNGWYTKASGGTRLGTQGDKYTVNSDHTVYAQWGTASFVLPDCKKEGTFFIGWFDKAQTNGNYESTSGAKLIGTAGQTVQLKSSQTLYAWFNTAPEINQIDSADFYEGQYVFGRDFIQFVEPKDIESEQAGQTLEVELVSIEYNDGNKKELSEDTLIETSTNHIGEFKVTYSVTDIGISIDGKLVPNSQVTTEETFTFKVVYNDLPQMVLNPVIYTYTSDASLVEATIASFLKSYVTLSDAQDDVDNKPWWDVDVTSAYLKQSLEITEVKDILVNPAYEMEHADIANAIRNSTSVEQLYALKISNPEAFNAIMSYKVVFDAKDQWGKFVSGKLAERAVAHGVRASEIDKKQSEDDRSITVISVNDSAFNDTYESIRSVNAKYASSVNGNSYWGDENYGGKILNEILSKRSNKDSEDHEIYEGLYAQVTNYGNNINILVNDYAN